MCAAHVQRAPHSLHFVSFLPPPATRALIATPATTTGCTASRAARQVSSAAGGLTFVSAAQVCAERTCKLQSVSQSVSQERWAAGKPQGLTFCCRHCRACLLLPCARSHHAFHLSAAAQPAGTCKEKLTSTNTYTCRDCGITVCLKHRLPADHACPGRAAAAAAAAAAAKGRLSLSQSLRRMLSGNGGGGAAQRPASAGSNGSGRTGAVARATAAAVRTKESVSNQLQQYRQRQRAGAPPGGSGGSTAPAAPNSDVIDLTSPVAARPASGAEECPQCGARFASVQQLIEHAETAHAGGWSSGAVGMQHAAAAAGPASGGALERCPHCSQQFSDPVELVAHVERRHGAAAGGSNGSALDNCVLC